ncbi:MAG: YtxH domain-containing protein [Patescibacteria group bacterium]|nr:YtxH domain-containing protein [Patescibacteria group bacterium]
MSEHKTTNNIFPFLLGILCGAVLGVLLAPEKGEISRRKLKKKADELKGNLEPSLKKMRHDVEPLVSRISEKAEPLISGFKKIEELGAEVSQGLNESYDDGEESLPIDTSLSDHRIDLPVEKIKPVKESPGGENTSLAKPKRKTFFKNIH